MKMARLAAGVAAIGLALSTASSVRGQGIHDHRTANAPPGGLVDAVRNATRQFMEIGNATDAGYGPFLGCVSGAQDGAMGVHYVNPGYVDDNAIEVEHPEALMYEVVDGHPQLLGVEYIVKAEPWNARHPQPPELLGQVFTFNTSPNRFGLPDYYALHVWAWKDNPHGTFVDFNPQVNCDTFVGQ